MGWLLVGICGLALVHLSAPLPQDFRIVQWPRFYGVQAGRSLVIHCVCSLNPIPRVDWFWAPVSDLAEEQIHQQDKVVMGVKQNIYHLILKDVTPKDSGVYYCQINGIRGSGTGLNVMRPVSVHKAENRSRFKDAFIFLQTLMLAICIAAWLLRRYTLVKKEDAIYEDPQQDHIYEGLAVETCEGELYEDISSYAQAGGAEAPWQN